MSGWKFAPECRLCVHAKCRADKHPCNVCMSCVRSGFYRDNFDAKGPDNANLAGPGDKAGFGQASGCENCGNAATKTAAHPEIGYVKTCNDCFSGQGMKAVFNANLTGPGEQAGFGQASGCKEVSK